MGSLLALRGVRMGKWTLHLLMAFISIWIEEGIARTSRLVRNRCVSLL
jgi:hypothetical protein